MITNRDEIASDSDRELALDCIEAGIAASDPVKAIRSNITTEGDSITVQGDRFDTTNYDRIFVIGGGNAAATASDALETALGERIDDGIVVTDNHVDTERIRVFPGNHPVPNKRGLESTQALIEFAAEFDEDDLVFAIITGGGSSLLAAPEGDLTLESLQTVNEQLLSSGASIDEINIVRKHLSDIKGGQLAVTSSPATVIGLIFSDVIGNRLDTVASGPLTPDESTYADALKVISRYSIDLPPDVLAVLNDGMKGNLPETPDRSHPVFDQISQYVLTDGMTALRGAIAPAKESNYQALLLGDRICGESKEVAKALVGIAESCVSDDVPAKKPAVLVSGGETTVSVDGIGEGGPNHEFTLSAVIASNSSLITVASVDTDGIDGNTEAAGAIARCSDIEDSELAQDALDNNNAGQFLRDAGYTIRTGPTTTNVNDLRVIVISREQD